MTELHQLEEKQTWKLTTSVAYW